MSLLLSILLRAWLKELHSLQHLPASPRQGLQRWSLSIPWLPPRSPGLPMDSTPRGVCVLIPTAVGPSVAAVLHQLHICAGALGRQDSCLPARWEVPG